MQNITAQLRRLVNLATEFTFEDKTYKVKEAPVKVRFAFAAWVEQRAKEAIERFRMNSDTDSDLREAKAALIGEIAAGKYEWGGEYVIMATTTMTGSKYLLYLMMREDNVGITEEIVSDIYDANLHEIDETLANSKIDPKDFAEMVSSVTGQQ